jgi:hypothetical protein
MLAPIKDISTYQRPQNVKHRTEEDFRLYHLTDAEMHYPVQSHDLERIEQVIDIPINVFIFFDDESKASKPIYTSKLGDPQK